MFSLFFFCTEHLQGALHPSWHLWQSPPALPFPSMLLMFYLCINVNLEPFPFPATLGLLPMDSEWQSLPTRRKKLPSWSWIHRFNVWQKLFLVTAEFLSCTAPFVFPERWPFSAHRASGFLGMGLLFGIALYVEGSYTVAVVIRGMQIYYLMFSNSVGAHVYLVHLSAVFK